MIELTLLCVSFAAALWVLIAGEAVDDDDAIELPMFRALALIEVGGYLVTVWYARVSLATTHELYVRQSRN